MKEYDYLIVGSGLWGSVFAYEAKKNGYKCLVIDKRYHHGGNIYTESVEGINIHKYGVHIFYTNDTNIWNYINQFDYDFTYNNISFNEKLKSFLYRLTGKEFFGYKNYILK